MLASLKMLRKNNAKSKSEKRTKVCPIKKSSESQTGLPGLVIKPKLIYQKLLNTENIMQMTNDIKYNQLLITQT